jgi:hypothetical protein
LADLHIAELLGETRAAIVERGRLVEMHIARDGDGLTAGARVPARLVRRLGDRAIADLGGEEAVIEPWPHSGARGGVTEGATTIVEVVRAAWREPGRDRLAKARPTPLGAWPAPALGAALVARGHVLRPGWPSEVAGQWDDNFEAAELGRVPIDGGSLHFTPTPAFIAVDVDGGGRGLTAPALTMLARTIRLWGLGGSIVIDLPPSGDKALRTIAAEGFDRVMAMGVMGSLAFERTAINGFGLMQVVRPRPGPSILERAQLERAATAAIALLATAANETRAGAARLVARPDIIRWLEQRPHLVEALARRAGRRVDLKADPMAGTGHVEA